MQNIDRLAVLVIIMLIGTTPAFASSQKKEGAVRKDRSSRPINIKADELKADNKGKLAVFTGRVVARQEDVTIYSDKLMIHYGRAQDQVDKIEAVGKVRILQANRVGTGGHAVYESSDGKITLSESPKVTQEMDSITGKVIVYYVDDDRSVVTSGENSRVEAVIYPKQGAGSRK